MNLLHNFNSHRARLPVESQNIFTSVMIGALSTKVNEKDWMDCLETAKSYPGMIVAPTFDKTPMELVDGASRHMAGEAKL
jgi:hypothetical protein